MAMTAHPPVVGSRPVANRWGPWLLAGCGLVLLATAAYHRQRYAALDAEVDRKVLELKQGREALQRAAAEAGNNPVGGMLAAFAALGGSPEVNALAVEREHHHVRSLQFAGPGGAAAVAGLAWAWIVRRVRRAAAAGTPGGGRAVMATAAVLFGAAATALFLLHLRASSAAWEEAGPALAPWWLAVAVGNGFAVYLARPRSLSAYVFAAVLALYVASIGALYTNSSDLVGMFLGYGESTADEDWYLGVSAVVAMATLVLLRVATPRVGHRAAEPGAAPDGGARSDSATRNSLGPTGV